MKKQSSLVLRLYERGWPLRVFYSYYPPEPSTIDTPAFGAEVTIHKILRHDKEKDIKGQFSEEEMIWMEDYIAEYIASPREIDLFPGGKYRGDGY